MRGRDQRPNSSTSHMDTLMGVFDRSAMLTALFRETDRAQRMRTPLSLLLFEIDGLRSSCTRHGTEAYDQLLYVAVSSVGRLLRSYDVLGRMSEFQFLVILPGCGPLDAALLAERLRAQIFANPFPIADERVQLSAYFGISSSEGRSPVVVLREAEQSVQSARKSGLGAIVCHTYEVNQRTNSTVLGDHRDIASSTSAPSPSTPRNS